MLAVENNTKVMNDLYNDLYNIDFNERFLNKNDCIDNHTNNMDVSEECATSTDNDITGAERKGRTSYNKADFLDFLHLHSQLHEIQYFQPQISSERQCVALALVGHQHFTRKWVKIKCSQYFSNITVICQSHTQNISKPNNKRVDETTYANIKYIKNNNGRLRVERKYCVEGWYHVEGQCHKISPFHIEECEHNSPLDSHHVEIHPSTF